MLDATLAGDAAGALAIGQDLLQEGITIEQALDRSLGAEFNAKVAWLARSLGEANHLAFVDQQGSHHEDRRRDAEEDHP